MLPPPPTPTLFPYTTLFRSLRVRPDPNVLHLNARLPHAEGILHVVPRQPHGSCIVGGEDQVVNPAAELRTDRKSTRLNSSHQIISYAVFCLKKKINNTERK